MFRKFADELIRHNKIGLITHINPDGDAIGSQLALDRWLRVYDKETLMFNDDPVPSNLKWLKNQEQIQVPSNELLDSCDAFLFIDGNQPSRFGVMEEYFKTTDKPVYLIDHHMDPPENFFRAMVWDPDASSTAYLVYKVIEAKDPERIDQYIAEALYCGILTDTGLFRYDTVTAETHFVIGDIIERGGIRPGEINSRIYDDKTLSQLHLLGMVLHDIRLFCNDSVAITRVTEKMLKETRCEYDDLEGFVNYPLGIGSVQVSVMFYERNEHIKISFRGKSKLDLNRLAGNFNGGGHFNAAGATHPGPIEIAEKEVLEVLGRLMNG